MVFGLQQTCYAYCCYTEIGECDCNERAKRRDDSNATCQINTGKSDKDQKRVNNCWPTRFKTIRMPIETYWKKAKHFSETKAKLDDSSKYFVTGHRERLGTNKLAWVVGSTSSEYEGNIRVQVDNRKRMSSM